MRVKSTHPQLGNNQALTCARRKKQHHTIGRSGLIHPDSLAANCSRAPWTGLPELCEHGFPEGTPPCHLSYMAGSDRGHPLQVSEAENTSLGLPARPPPVVSLSGLLLLLLGALLALAHQPLEQAKLTGSPPKATRDVQAALGMCCLSRGALYI